MLFWLFTFVLNVNHTSSQRNTSSHIFFMYSTESVIWNFSTTALCILFLTRDIFYKSLATFFSWRILRRRCCKWTLIVLANTFRKQAQTIWGPYMRQLTSDCPFSDSDINSKTSHCVSYCTYMHEGHIFLHSGTWYL